MPFANEHAARIVAPGKFSRFRRENDFFAAGIDVIWGINSEGKTEMQAIRFDSSKFTTTEARAWLKSHKIKVILFEAAIGKKESTESSFMADDIALPDSLRISGSAGGIITFAAPVAKDGEILKDSRKKFSMIAYSGGVMSPRGFGPTVVDLDGLDINGGRAIAILMNHDESRIVGHSESIRKKNNLSLSGIVSGVGEAAKEVIATSENGFPWQSSIGAEIVRGAVSFLGEDDKTIVNGQKQIGPLNIIRASVLREVSFVPVGADSETSAIVTPGNDKN